MKHANNTKTKNKDMPARQETDGHEHPANDRVHNREKPQATEDDDLGRMTGEGKKGMTLREVMTHPFGTQQTKGSSATIKARPADDCPHETGSKNKSA